MNINFDTVATDMLTAMKGVLSNDWSKVGSTTRQFVQSRKARLKMLSESYLSGDITKQEFESFLENEKKIFEAEIDALQVVTKALTQKVANEAIDVLVKAVRAAI